MAKGIHVKTFILSAVLAAGVCGSLLNVAHAGTVANPCRSNAAETVKIGKFTFRHNDAADVESSFDDMGYPIITLIFSKTGALKFRAAQKGLLGKNLPICLGKDLIINPILNEYIQGNSVQISGGVHGDNRQLVYRLRKAFGLN